MKFILLILAAGLSATISIATPAAAFSPTAPEIATYDSSEIKQALKEFSALAARLRVGMSYQNYAEQVANLSATLDAVPEKERLTLPYLNLSLALVDYENALNAWQSYIEGDGRQGFIPADSRYGSLLVKTYGVEIIDILGSSNVHLKTALSQVWKQAKANINKAKRL